MKKTVLISITTASFLLANDLGTIDVSEELLSQKVENVSSEELKSADLAEALSKSSSSVNLIRRSGIANDILVRSQKKIIYQLLLMMLKYVEHVQIGWIHQHHI